MYRNDSAGLPDYFNKVVEPELKWANIAYIPFPYFLSESDTKFLLFQVVPRALLRWSPSRGGFSALCVHRLLPSSWPADEVCQIYRYGIWSRGREEEGVRILLRYYAVSPLTLRSRYPGHEEIELALIRTYDVTGDPVQLNLSHYFIKERGTHRPEGHYYDVEAKARGVPPRPGPGHGPPYSYHQADRTIGEMTSIEGHSVRAM